MILAQRAGLPFYMLSGVTEGKTELANILKKHRNDGKIVVFIDEIHRWNKAQQDALLGHVESGKIILMGATTENPSFSVNAALMSRMRVAALRLLDQEDLETLIDRAMAHLQTAGKKITISDEARHTALMLSGGDARILLNGIELACEHAVDGQEVSKEMLEDVFLRKSAALYDKKGEEHYATISAFIKSMRASHVDAALYYLMRMLEGGEDPLFITRRMMIFASEDIGMADRGALIQAYAAHSAAKEIGMPEAALILSHGVVYLAKAKKSRSVANALLRAKKAVHETLDVSIPLHLRNATTRFNQANGYARGYTWGEEFVGITDPTLPYLPPPLQDGDIWKE
jgi:putative ATPase